MSVKKIKVGNLEYLEGEVTLDDVQVSEVETTEKITDGEHYCRSNITSKIMITIKDEIRDLLYARKVERGECMYGGNGEAKAVVYNSIKSNKEPAIKRMRTEHKRDCEKGLSQAVIDRESERIVKNANWEIRSSRETFIEKLSRSFGGEVEWDNEEKLDELDDMREELREKIRELEKEMVEIMTRETKEWLEKNVPDSDMHEAILSKIHFGSYMPQTIEFGVPRRRKKRKQA